MRASHAVVVSRPRGRGRGARPRRPRDLRIMCAGSVIEIYKDVGLPEVFAEAFELGDLRGHSRARSHPDGDGEPGDDRGLAPVLDRASTSASSTTARSRTTTRCGGRCVARGSSSRRRTTPRWRRATLEWRLREGATLEPGVGGLPRRPRRLLHVRPWGRRRALQCCGTRSPASLRCSRRPTTGWRWRPSTTRLPVLPGADDATSVGTRARRCLRLGPGAAVA